ncbi:ParB/RepB/Spo0J family partition protein [Streptomyces vinaceus]
MTGKDGVPVVLPLREISTNPDNPRDGLGDLRELAASLQSVGQVQAITIASVDAYLRDRPEMESLLDLEAAYVVVDGHRRLAAAKLAGLKTVKVFVDDALATTDRSLLEAAFVANVHRKDLTDLESAQALQLLVGHHGSQHEAARRIGKSQAYVSQKLSLLSLATELQADLAAGRRKVSEVRGLARVPAEKQKEIADRRAEEAAARKIQNRTDRSDNSVIGSPVPVPRDPEAAGAPSTDYSVNSSVGEPPALTDPAHCPSAADNSVIASDASTGPSDSADGRDHPVLTRGLWSPLPDLSQLADFLRRELGIDQRLTLANLLMADNKH